MRIYRAIKKSELNSWIVAGLIFFNLFAWLRLLLNAPEPYIVEPLRDPEVVALLDYISSGDHSEEHWQVNLTQQEAEQTIAWYLQKYPQIPFAHPHVEITPNYVFGEGDAIITGMRVHVSGKARVTVVDGLPIVEILELSIPLPGPIKNALEREIQVQLQRADLLPVRFTSAEWNDGVVIVEGFIR